MTRLGQSAFSPAITNDIAGPVGNPALAERIDAEKHAGLPPYAGYVARTAFLHTLAFNEPLKGATPERIRYAVLGPSTDFSFVEEARKAFVTESAFLDDRPGSPMRFVAEPNLTKLIQTEEQNVDAGRCPRASQRPHSGDTRRFRVRRRAVPRRSVRRAGRRDGRQAKAGRPRVRRRLGRRACRRSAGNWSNGYTSTGAPRAQRCGSCGTVWSSSPPTRRARRTCGAGHAAGSPCSG